MKKFFKSIWFPVILFLAIELILFILGTLLISIYPTCELINSEAIGSICEATYYGLEGGIILAIIGIIPSLIISIVTYLILKRKNSQ